MAHCPAVSSEASRSQMCPLGRSFAIPCGGIQPPLTYGCLGRAELFTVAAMDGSGGGRGVGVSPRARVSGDTASAATEGGLRQELVGPMIAMGTGALVGG